MKVLLDSHVLIEISLNRMDRTYPRFAAVLAEPGLLRFASAASIWEIAIKARLGKLNVGGAIEALPDLLRRGGLDILQVDDRHAVASLLVEPPTRDPFDRMLLAQCQVEGMRLVTADGALADHPPAWREA